MRNHMQDTQCQWCGGYEVMQCVTCQHAECDNCGAGGYCDCNQTRQIDPLRLATGGYQPLST